MIARLSGHLASVEEDAVVVDVGGIGYRINVPQSVLGAASVGGEITLFTHLHVRENELSLYGATDEAALRVFRLLLGVSGVGPKVAIAMLSALEPPALLQAIGAEDAATLTRVPGVGRKLAERIVLELKGRVGAVPAAGSRPRGPLGPADTEAQAALISLGYTTAEAQRALAGAPADEGDSTEQRLVAALRYLAGG